MIKEWLDSKKNSNTIICFQCDKCSEEFKRPNKVYQKMIKKPIYGGADLCNRCCRCVVNNTPEYKKRMSKVVKTRYLENPEIIEKIRQSTRGKINLGDANGMKKTEAQQKVSIARHRMFLNPDTRKEYSDKTKKAWRDGKFEGVRVGQCKWFEYKHSNGETYKVQGSWELAFNLRFQCHRGNLHYRINGESHTYYPDFWIYDWNKYVDIKATCFYAPEKFNAIRECNPKVCVSVLFKEDLIKLGVKL